MARGKLLWNISPAFLFTVVAMLIKCGETFPGWSE